MPAPNTIDEFLELVRKSGVVDEKRLSAYIDKLRAAEQLPPQPIPLATQLVCEGVLTHFQAEQFLQGKWRRFTIGKYKVLERLGAGGMGSVYLCEHMLMRRRVAVKVLPAAKSEDTSSLERFYREARAVAALDHPNIVRAYDIDQDDNLHFLVMEHVDGSSLQEIIRRTRMMDVLRAAHYTRQAALGLQHAHETAALVHRDIKPGNILVDRNGIVKILDMGLARFFHDEEDLLTKKYDENVLGTADYLAPEQALDSHAVDIRADIYSLGATFYFCLTGRTPFSEGSVAQKLIWHQTRAPKPIRSFRPEVPEGIVGIIDRMMAKDANQRYQSPQEVAEALAPWTQTPIPPPPDSEMPQFSLAATRALTETGSGAPSLTSRPPSDASPPPRKVWQVSGSGSGPSTTTAANTPPVPAQHQGNRNARSGPSTTTAGNTQPAVPAAPLREVRPAPAPAAVVAPPVAARAPAAAIASAPRAEIRTASPAGAPQGSTPNGAGKLAIQTAPAPAPQEEWLETAEEVSDEDEDGSFRSNPARASRRDSSRRNKSLVKKLPLLWIILGLVVVLGVPLLGLLIYLFLPSAQAKKAQSTARELHVGPSTPSGLGGALRNAIAGDHIILDVDINECDLTVPSTKPHITIEAAPGKKIVWKCPASAKPDPKVQYKPKLIILQAVGGVTIRGITMDGDNKTEALVMVYGKCPGVKLENLYLRNSKDADVMFANCEGDSDNPVQMVDLDFLTSKNASAVRFIITPTHLTIRKNRFIAFRTCVFNGPGMKLTTPDPGNIDPGSLSLPEGMKVEKR